MDGLTLTPSLSSELPHITTIRFSLLLQLQACYILSLGSSCLQEVWTGEAAEETEAGLPSTFYRRAT